MPVTNVMPNNFKLYEMGLQIIFNSYFSVFPPVSITFMGLLKSLLQTVETQTRVELSFKTTLWQRLQVAAQHPILPFLFNSLTCQLGMWPPRVKTIFSKLTCNQVWPHGII